MTVRGPALIVIAKSPVPGRAKTRLCPPLDEEEAASLHGSLVLDAIERTKGMQGITLYVAGAANSPEEGVTLAQETIDSGAATQKLAEFAAASQAIAQG